MLYYWIAFLVFVIFMLALDLGVFNRKNHEISVKEAMIWSGVWIGLAVIFNIILFFTMGKELALQFSAGYIIEKSLSVDNLFVFVVIFSYFKIKKIYQHKILFWGILGALIMRAIFIFAGVKIIESFHWVMYIFGVFLIITAVKMLFEGKEEIEFESKMIVKLVKKIVPVTKNEDGGKFFTIENGKKYATPLFLALVMIEFTDLIFAVDSIPAILGVSNNMFILYTSNIFAILGLRSLYFALAGIIDKFAYLKYGLAGILTFVGIKMLIGEFYKFPIVVSLGIIIGFLVTSALASYYFPPKEKN